MEFLLQVGLLLFSCRLSAAISCLDNANKPVDWFIVYKLPVRHAMDVNRKWPFPPHLYMDSNSPTFKLLNSTLNDTDQAVSFTLQQAHSNRHSPDVGYIFYNDEKPVAAGGGYTEKFGHTKGVTVFDSDSSFWMVHSVPKFPPPTNSSYMYPDNAVYYGQHIFCFSTASDVEVSRIGFATNVGCISGTQLTFNQPWIYDHHLPALLASKYPTMKDAISGAKQSRTSNVAVIQSSKGISFISFAKSAQFNQDLYAAIVAPSLQCNLKTETWQNGPKASNLPSACNQTYTVETVLYVGSQQFNLHFSDHEDHSKFAVCGSGGYICIGDINRQVHQLVRGGGTVCFYDAQVQKQYLSLILSVEKCKKRYNNA